MQFDHDDVEEEENALNMDALSKMNIANTKVSLILFFNYMR